LPVDLTPMLPHLPAWLLVLFRITGIFFFAPMLGGQVIPARVKVLLALGLSLCVYPALLWEGSASAANLGQVIGHDLPFWSLPVMIAMELSVGAVIGFAAMLPVVGMQMGGRVMDMQLGLRAAGLFNPDLGDESGILAEFLYLLSIALFIILGGHLVLFKTLVMSFDQYPPGGFAYDGSIMDMIIGLLTVSFNLAMRVAAPVLCMMFLLSVAMGFIQKTVPQLNILSVGFPLRICIGVGILVAAVAVLGGIFAEVLERVLSQSKGPLPGRTIEGVYKELMSGSFALEQPLRIGFLGPPGSHSHHAAVTQFGSSVAYEDLHEITGVFTEVRRGHVDYGLVPIENTTGGGIADTLMAFQEHAGSVAVYGEILISIHHALLSNVKPSEVKRIHSKPEVFSQCKTWLATQYPGAELISAASSSRAAQTALEENKKAVEIGAQPQAAAVGSKLAGQIYGLKVLFPRIEDNPDNITRFFILSAQRAERSGDDKTSIMFQTVDKPGALVEVLGVFDRAGINLSHIDKRPSGRVNWEYTFFIDAAGHRDDPGMARAILEAEKHCKDLTVLGSYPRAKRIL